MVATSFGNNFAIFRLSSVVDHIGVDVMLDICVQLCWSSFESPYCLDIYRRTNSLWASMRFFFFNVYPVARTESNQIKIVFRLGTIARRPSWKWVRKARLVAITESSFLKKSLWWNHVVDQTTPFHYVFTENKRCAVLQLSIFIDLNCHSNWIA